MRCFLFLALVCLTPAQEQSSTSRQVDLSGKLHSLALQMQAFLLREEQEAEQHGRGDGNGGQLQDVADGKGSSRGTGGQRAPRTPNIRSADPPPPPDRLDTDSLREALLKKIHNSNHSTEEKFGDLVATLQNAKVSWGDDVRYCWNSALSVHKKCGGKNVVTYNDLNTKVECERKAIAGKRKNYAWVDSSKRCQVFNGCTKYKTSSQPWKVYERCFN